MKKKDKLFFTLTIFLFLFISQLPVKASILVILSKSFPQKSFVFARVIALLLTALSLSGCFNSERSKMISVGKCYKAGRSIENAELVAAAQYKMGTSLSQIPGGAREAMEIGQELNDELYPAGSSTKTSYVLKIANKWKSSSYCEKVLEEFRAHIKEQAIFHSKPVGNPAAPDSCQRFVAQYRMASYPYAKQFSKELTEAVTETIKNASTGLKEYQQDYVNALFLTENSKVIAGVMNKVCQEGGSVEEKIKSIDEIRDLKSPRTKSLADHVEALASDEDCGDLKEIYCRAHLTKQAAHDAYSKSRQCDRNEAEEEVCAADENELFERELQRLELSMLNKAKNKYENYMAAPEKYNPNTVGNIYLISEKCKKRALRQFTGEEYYEYVRQACMPEAREEFLQPEKELLKKVNVRLAEFQEEERQ